jgi:hypothetical protein
MSFKRPALEPQTVEPVAQLNYPEPYGSRVLPREPARGYAWTHQGGYQSHDAAARQEILHVSLAHVRGRIHLHIGVLVRGFSGGGRGRHLEVSNRDAEDSAYYTDSDVDLTWSPPHARGRYTRRDGMPF